ncbi:MAG: diacylglycerol kinase family lipid kinase [Clostridia bacterium]|nr:diacylglycerol kinase family lipid kinase [Clostridia bacterium]MBQ1965687.1 diacylglycerol kinase family lipid kinase [Clostridia bacterium]
MNKHVFILNPQAGFKKTAQMKELIQKTFGKLAEIRLTERAGHATEIAKEYVNSIIYAVGGDGTANEVMCGTVGSSNTLCVIPQGSGNDFVRSLYTKITKKHDPKTILKCVKDFCKRNIDCGKANESFFMNIASVGFDAEVVRNSEKFKDKPGLRKISYILSMLYTIFSFHGVDLEGEIDGIPFKQKSLLFCIANGKYYGGGIKIAPEAVIDDGKLDAYLIESVPAWLFLSILPLLAMGKHTKLKFVKHVRAEKIVIRGKDLTLNLDGELSPAPEARFEVLPRGLSVLSPTV